MTSERRKRVEQVFGSALKLDPKNRASFLEEACSDDFEVREEVERLLEESAHAGSPVMEARGHGSSLTPGELVANRYRIKRLLGRGGMGEVYEAHDRLLQENVALKTLRNDQVDSMPTWSRFQREIQLARRVTHPNVCRIFDVGIHELTDQPRPSLRFFSMELLEGETLSRRIRRQGRLTKTEAFPIIIQMAEGLQAAHDAGIVHTDFKSGNVILVPKASGDRAVITDFGLAHFDPAAPPPEETETMRASGQVVGTLAYMSPEQLKSEPVRPSSDIYSFGIVLFEMAAGQLPFESRHVIQSAMQRASDQNIAVRSLVPGIDPRWESAIIRCLQKDPGRRFRSAGDLAMWFRGGEWHAPFRYWTRREWMRAGIAAGVPAAATVGIWIRLTRPYRPRLQALEWYRKGASAMHSMTYEAARKALEQSVAADPKFALAHASLARVYDELDYSDQAKESMLRAVAIAQETRLSSNDSRRLRAFQAVISQDYERAGNLFDAFENEAPPEERAAAAIETGWLAQKRDNTASAQSAYERAVKLDPSYPAAKLRLGFILGRRGGKNDLAALDQFSEAERLYGASSDYEGITETLLQRANLLNRRSRAAEAMPVIERALQVARTVGNRYQEIRLLQLQGTAFRNLGDTDRAAALAREAIDAAVRENMDNLAVSGLIDLGNSYFVRGEIKAAEPIFRQALDLANRRKVRRLEARAQFSLGSLYEQNGRPEEAKRVAEAVLPFYRQAAYRREFVQSCAVLGGALDQLAEYDDGARILNEAVSGAVQLGERPLEGQARERLGDILYHQSAWPAALEEYKRAAEAYGSSVQGGYVRVSAAAVYWQLGQRQDGERSWSEAQQLQKKTQNQRLQSVLRAYQANVLYADGHLNEALMIARQVLASSEVDAEAKGELSLIESLVLIRTGPGAGGQELAAKVTAGFDRSKLIATAASARLRTAEALLAAGRRESSGMLVREALDFFAPRRIWESVWRSNLIAAKAFPSEAERYRSAARLALIQLKTLWPAGSIEKYLARPDIKRLAGDLVR